MSFGFFVDWLQPAGILPASPLTPRVAVMERVITLINLICSSQN
jgi:hypothetical protein